MDCPPGHKKVAVSGGSTLFLHTDFVVYSGWVWDTPKLGSSELLD